MFHRPDDLRVLRVHQPDDLQRPQPIDLGARWELFVDRALVQSLDGVALRLHAPEQRGTVLAFDRPWEGAFCGYATLIEDRDAGGERLLRLYYRGLPSAGADGSPQECTCYAESRDGTTWHKPNLQIHEVGGTRDNNVVLASAAPATHNFCPFLDTRPGVPPAERYKALGGTSESGLLAFVSPDGLHWSKLQDEAVFRDQGWVFDSQNVPFWSESESCYVLYYRRSPQGVRAVARATSPDFRQWSAGTQMEMGDAPPEHLYTNQTRPYFRAPHLYLGVAARFMPGRRVLSDEEAQRIQVNPKYFGDISDAVLLSSRGGARYERTFLESFIRPGIGIENWVSRTNYPALGIVPTGPSEISIYVQKNYGQPTAHLDRYALRTDGFASLHADYAGGTVVTRPLAFDLPTGGNPAERQLLLNFSSSAAGSVRVEVLDGAGQPIPGYTLDDAPELIGDEIERAYRWRDGKTLGSLAGQTVQLRFRMKDADLYAFGIR